MDSSYDWKSEDWLENHFVISCPVTDEFLTTTLSVSKRCAHKVPETGYDIRLHQPKDYDTRKSSSKNIHSNSFRQGRESHVLKQKSLLISSQFDTYFSSEETKCQTIHQYL